MHNDSDDGEDGAVPKMQSFASFDASQLNTISPDNLDRRLEEQAHRPVQPVFAAPLPPVYRRGANNIVRKMQLMKQCPPRPGATIPNLRWVRMEVFMCVCVCVCVWEGVDDKQWCWWRRSFCSSLLSVIVCSLFLSVVCCLLLLLLLLSSSSSLLPAICCCCCIVVAVRKVIHSEHLCTPPWKCQFDIFSSKSWILVSIASGSKFFFLFLMLTPFPPTPGPFMRTSTPTKPTLKLAENWWEQFSCDAFFFFTRFKCVLSFSLSHMVLHAALCDSQVFALWQVLYCMFEIYQNIRYTISLSISHRFCLFI